MMKFSLAVLASALAPAAAVSPFNLYGISLTPRYFDRVATFYPCSAIDGDTHCEADEVFQAGGVALKDDILIYGRGGTGGFGFLNIADLTAIDQFSTFESTGFSTTGAVCGDLALMVFTEYGNLTYAAFDLTIGINETIADSGVENAFGEMGTAKGSAFSIVAADDCTKFITASTGSDESGDPGTIVIIDLEDVEDPFEGPLPQEEIPILGANFADSILPSASYVAVNSQDIAVVTFSSNNGFAFVDVDTQSIIGTQSADVVDITNVDLSSDGEVLLVESELEVERGPFGVAWITDRIFATADAGTLAGVGGKTFTIWLYSDGSADPIFTSGNDLIEATIMSGHYADMSSEVGLSVLGVSFGIYGGGFTLFGRTFGGNQLLFVSAANANLVFVYDVRLPRFPRLRQVLPTGTAPAFLTAVPDKDLLIVSNAQDSPSANIRANIMFFRLEAKRANYPQLYSTRSGSFPIPFGALSGLTAPGPTGTFFENLLGRNQITDRYAMFAVPDKTYGRGRILTISTFPIPFRPPRITNSAFITDGFGILRSMETELGITDALNPDNTINLDLEGIEMGGSGGFWVVAEASGDDPNLLIGMDSSLQITDVSPEPDGYSGGGFQGVAEWDDDTVVVLGKTGELLRYTISDGSWTQYMYDFPVATVRNDGNRFTTDIAYEGDGNFLLIDRDDQSGPAAFVKRVYRISLNGLNDGDLVAPSDLVHDIFDVDGTAGFMPEKFEGLALDFRGRIRIVNDNDGLAGQGSGDTLLLEL